MGTKVEKEREKRIEQLYVSIGSLKDPMIIDSSDDEQGKIR